MGKGASKEKHLSHNCKENPRTHFIYLLFKLFFPKMCFPSNYTKTSIKSLIRYGNASGAIQKVQLLECKGGFKTIKQSHSVSPGVEAKIAAIGIWELLPGNSCSRWFRSPISIAEMRTLFPEGPPTHQITTGHPQTNPQSIFLALLLLIHRITAGSLNILWDHNSGKICH